MIATTMFSTMARPIAVATTLALVSAAPAAAQQTAAQQRCTAAVYKAMRLGDKVFGKLVTGCLASDAKGKQSVDECFDSPSPVADATLLKMSSLIFAACDGNDKDGVSRFPEFGVNPGVDGFGLAVFFLTLEIESLSITFYGDGELADVLGDYATDKALANCQLAIRRQQTSCRAAYLGAFSTCAKIGLKGSAKKGIAPFADPTELGACLTAAFSGKTAAACSHETGKFAATITKKCAAKGVDLADAVPACAATMLGPAECASLVSQCLACEAASGVADLVPDACDDVCVGVF